MVRVGSSGLTDEEFVSRFQQNDLTAAEFHHGDHLRLAWLHLDREPVEVAMENICSEISGFARHLGVPGVFHETMTRGWVRLLATHGERSFTEFLERNQLRLGRELLDRFWSPELLMSDAARRGWVSPDREALPPVVERMHRGGERF